MLYAAAACSGGFGTGHSAVVVEDRAAAAVVAAVVAAAHCAAAAAGELGVDVAGKMDGHQQMAAAKVLLLLAPARCLAELPVLLPAAPVQRRHPDLQRRSRARLGCANAPDYWGLGGVLPVLADMLIRIVVWWKGLVVGLGRLGQFGSGSRGRLHRSLDKVAPAEVY